jgi:hypothetical protein
MLNKPQPDSKEQKLLNRIFDNASSPDECKKAVELLKKELALDRAGLVEKYTNEVNGVDNSGNGHLWRAQRHLRGRTLPAEGTPQRRPRGVREDRRGELDPALDEKASHSSPT